VNSGYGRSIAAARWPARDDLLIEVRDECGVAFAGRVGEWALWLAPDVAAKKSAVLIAETKGQLAPVRQVASVQADAVVWLTTHGAMAAEAVAIAWALERPNPIEGCVLPLGQEGLAHLMSRAELFKGQCAGHSPAELARRYETIKTSVSGLTALQARCESAAYLIGATRELTMREALSVGEDLTAASSGTGPIRDETIDPLGPYAGRLGERRANLERRQMDAVWGRIVRLDSGILRRLRVGLGYPSGGPAGPFGALDVHSADRVRALEAASANAAELEASHARSIARCLRDGDEQQANVYRGFASRETKTLAKISGSIEAIEAQGRGLTQWTITHGYSAAVWAAATGGLMIRQELVIGGKASRRPELSRGPEVGHQLESAGIFL
jgi:hypothetical protein